MKYNQLGRTGLYVSEICLGAMTFAGENKEGVWAAMGDLGQTQVNGIIEGALASGVNFIDTADVYSFGESERLLGQALRDLSVKRSDVVIATKVHGTVGPGPNDRGASRGHILDSIRMSLDRMQLDHVDLYQIHANDPVTPVDEILRALDDIVRQGLVRYIGVSNWLAWKIAKALGVSAAKDLARFESVQAYYSIAGRDLERDVVPMALSEQLSVLVWSPLAGGLLSGKFGPGAENPEDSRRTKLDFPPVDRDRAWKCVAAMREVGDAHGVSVARVALAWLLSKPHVTSVIIGAKTIAQLEDNIAATDLTLTPEQIAKLDAVSDLAPEYPGWMVAWQDGARYPTPFTRKA